MQRQLSPAADIPSYWLGQLCARNRPSTSNPATVVGPVQQCLALTRPTHGVAGLAMTFDLRNVASDRFPAFDLPRILFRHSAAHVVAAVPLKPAPRVIGMNPALFAPD